MRAVPWYDTVNIHLCTILDFIELCEDMNLNIEQGLTLDRKGKYKPIGATPGRANLFGEQGVFLLERR
ncbi:MAG: hypothetical protein CMM23_06930 [Rhodospirillaceae bacterium]|nr:hypothetical protein [Rhodospirillaceae bacterium]